MRFRKKPVVIEAVQWNGKNVRQVYEFMHGSPQIQTSPQSANRWYDYVSSKEGKSWEIETLEGVITASVNDWIIKGISGEFYPCKPDIFGKTYEQVD